MAQIEKPLHWALWAPDLDALVDLIDVSPREVFRRCWPAHGSQLALEGDLGFARVYFGNEVCDRLIEAEETFRRARALARDRKMGFSVVAGTPTDPGLDAWHRVLAVLVGDGAEDLEMVVNDFGLLRMVAREYPSMVRVLGRHMRRRLKDHRLPGGADDMVLGRATEVDPSAEELAFLATLGVARIEHDLSPWGGVGLRQDTGIDGSCYFPAGISATGRICMAAAMHASEGEKFVPNAPCRRECRAHTFRVKNEPSGPGDAPQVYWKGNTVFYVPSVHGLKRTLAELPEVGVDRVVLEAGLPM